MKVLHISTSDRNGGAHIAAYRLMEAMNSIGITSQMLVFNKTTTSPYVIGICEKKSRLHRFIIIKFQLYLSYVRIVLLNLKLPFSIGKFHLVKKKDLAIVNEFDAIYIHWTQLHFLNLKDISCLLECGKPAFLFFHDMWYFTGGCHFSFDCDRWRSGCEKCPQINNIIFSGFSKYLFMEKKKIFGKGPINIIVPSSWVASCVKESPVFKNAKISIFPNTINTNVFCVRDKNSCRKELNLPLNRKLILFGAQGGVGNVQKGWNYVHQAMLQLSEVADLVVFGSGGQNFSFTVHSFGHLYEEQSLAKLYNAVDIYVSPTLAESFGQTILESVSCGTKAVVFNVGGTPDIIIHRDNGYLVNYCDEEDLKKGINWALISDNSNNERERLHKYVENKFSYKVVADAHKSLIDSVR